MCLGEVLGKITNPGGSKKSQPQTPDPVGKESVVRPLPVGEPKVEDKKKGSPGTTGKMPQKPSTSSSTSMTDTGINY